jgi:hypothetical protein
MTENSGFSSTHLVVAQDDSVKMYLVIIDS